VWSSRWNENWQGKPKYSEKTFPSATSSTTNPIYPELGSNPGHYGGKPTTNRLKYATAHFEAYFKGETTTFRAQCLVLRVLIGHTEEIRRVLFRSEILQLIAILISCQRYVIVLSSSSFFLFSFHYISLPFTSISFV
jgi:hypothetical protein